MRKTTFMLLAVLAVSGTVFTLQSCSEAAKKIHYDLPLNSGLVEVDIPPTNDTTSTGKMATGAVNINIDSFIRAKTDGRLGVDNIKSVKLLSVNLTLVNGNAANSFANFASCFASFSSNSNSTPYEVSIKDNPDLTVYKLYIPVDPNAELKSYMRGNAYYYSVGGKLRRPITQTVRCKIEFQFNISVGG